jgi:large-conductance mechanosensitive channel
MILLRIILVCLIIFLIIRSFSRYREERDVINQNRKPDDNSVRNNKKISKEVGEYIDYEEADE